MSIDLFVEPDYAVCMARKPRVEFAGACYHVIARGNRRATLFHSISCRRPDPTLDPIPSGSLPEPTIPPNQQPPLLPLRLPFPGQPLGFSELVGGHFLFQYFKPFGRPLQPLGSSERCPHIRANIVLPHA